MSGDKGSNFSKEGYEIEEWYSEDSFLTIIVRGIVDIKSILENEEYEGLEVLLLRFEGIESPDISSLYGIEVNRLTLRSDDALELDFSKLEGMESGIQELWIGFRSIKKLDLSPLRHMPTLIGVSIGGNQLETVEFGSDDFSSIENLSIASTTDTLTITGRDNIPNLRNFKILGMFHEFELYPTNSENESEKLILRKIPIR